MDCYLQSDFEKSLALILRFVIHRVAARERNITHIHTQQNDKLIWDNFRIKERIFKHFKTIIIREKDAIFKTINGCLTNIKLRFQRRGRYSLILSLFYLITRVDQNVFHPHTNPS